MGGYFDDPNREAVGLEPAWAEGNGGSDTSAGGGPPPEGDQSDLEAMTKAELLDYARSLGVTPANNDMTKAELVDAVEGHQG